MDDFFHLSDVSQTRDLTIYELNIFFQQFSFAPKLFVVEIIISFFFPSKIYNQVLLNKTFLSGDFNDLGIRTSSDQA